MVLEATNSFYQSNLNTAKSSMDRLSLIEYILIFAMLVVIVLSGYLTIIRLVYGKQYICYDAWVFGTNTALLLQMYDNHSTKK
jgi:hypothetical protein